MVYIPSEWLNNSDNEKEIHDLLSQCSGCFRFANYQETVKNLENRLKELGENKILEEWRKGAFATG